jgi:hypothetical protein
MIDHNAITEEERAAYIENSILDLASLNELLDMFENLLSNDETPQNDHVAVAWLISNLKKAAVESMEKSLLDMNFFFNKTKS